MKIFITGGTGFIGSHIVMELLEAGDEVTILARNPYKIPEFRTMPRVVIVQGGLDDHETIRSVFPGHDACIHNALYWDEKPTELQLKDTRASVALFEAAASSGVKHLLYTSSTAVHRPFSPLMTEEDRLTPDDFYGATKMASEAFLSAFSYRTDMRGNVIRPGPTIGSSLFGNDPTVSNRQFNAFAQAVINRETPVLADSGRQFISVKDLAKLYAAILHSDANRQTYVAVAQNFTTWAQIAGEIATLTGVDSRPLPDHTTSPCLFDVSKIEREFGFRFDSQSAIRQHLMTLIDAKKQSEGLSV